MCDIITPIQIKHFNNCFFLFLDIFSTLSTSILYSTQFHKQNQITSNLLLYSLYYAEACNKFFEENCRSLEREVWGANLGPVKSDTVLPTARHRFDISSKWAVLPGRNNAEMGPANSLHALAYYSDYIKRFDLIFVMLGTLVSTLPVLNVCLCIL